MQPDLPELQRLFSELLMQTFDARLIGSLASLPLGGLLDHQSSGWLDNQNSENVSGIWRGGSFKYAMRKTFVM